MSDTRGKLIRPLLPFHRTELQDFAVKSNFQWREDSSNIQIDYKRNFLRHRIVPELGKFDPGALDILQYSFDRIKDTGKAFFYLFDSWLANNLQKEEDFQYLKIDCISKASGQKTLLYYWLRSYGFNFNQISDVLKSLEKQESGKTFLSGEFSLNLDREYLILGPRDSEQTEIWVEESAIELKMGNIHYDILVLKGDFDRDRSSLNAMLDRDKLTYPLKVRIWETGDKFRPLGMKKFKKISDFLIDLKVPMIHKRNIKVLCSGEEIVWVIGLRIDDRFKLSQFTKTALYFKMR
jgi:tRNA(Ile)-lysidine synthase